MFNRKLYIPRRAVIKDIKDATCDVKLYDLRFEDNEGSRENEFEPGQFAQVSVYGTGEVPISICSSPTQKGMQIAVKKMGEVTTAMHELKPGDKLGIRGPYGNSFPVENLKGRNLLFIAGGIGLAPLRSVLRYVLDRRGDFGKVTLLYGALNRPSLVFWNEIQDWSKSPDTKIFMTIDNPESGWTGNVGVVTTLFDKINNIDNNTTALVCGPSIMFKFAIRGLLEKGFTEENIVVTLERYMKCGVGKCGHCYLEGKYICTDGPVFTYKQLKKMSKDSEPEF